jgi:hypothetical protein
LFSLSIAIAVALAGSLKPKPLVAFSCRYYKLQGRSFHQIYIANVDGSQLRQITFGESEKTDVAWVGRNKISWIQSIGVSSRETYNGYHTPTDKQLNPLESWLVIYNLDTGKQEIVDTGIFDAAPQPNGQANFQRGTGVYRKYAPNRTPQYLELNDQISLFKVNQPETPYGEIDTGNPWASLPLDQVPQAVEEEFVFRPLSGETYRTESVVISNRGKSVRVPSDVDFVWATDDPHRNWFSVSWPSGSGGSKEWIFEIDWKRERVRPIIRGLLGIDFDPSYEFWASSSPNKDRTRIGTSWVWQRELWCGRTAGDGLWRIASGAVHGDSISVQPE